MSKISQAFKIAIENAFEERGARAEFLRRSGISQNTVHLWQKGERVPDLDQVEAVARALERPAIDLLFPGERPKPSREEIRAEALRMLEMGDDDFIPRAKHVQQMLEAEARIEALQTQLAQAEAEIVRLSALSAKRAPEPANALKKREMKGRK